MKGQAVFYALVTSLICLSQEGSISDLRDGYFTATAFENQDSESDGSETGKRLTVPSKDTHPACKKSDIFHSDVVEDHALHPGISPQNYTLLGPVPTMGDCMALCCSTHRCNIAYMKNNTCYGISCYDPEKCALANSTEGAVEMGTQLALILRNEINRRVYVTAYLVVVLCAFGAAMAGTVWAVFVFYKRYSHIHPFLQPQRTDLEAKAQEEGMEMDEETPKKVNMP